MSTEANHLSSAEALRKTRTYGKVRCHNPSCMGRRQPEPGVLQVTCPACGMAYRLYWLTPELPRIRGPVWEINHQLAADTLSRKLGLAINRVEP